MHDHHDERGITTAEYAVGTAAGAGLAGLLFKLLTGGFGAQLLRPQWYLVANSVITDVQNGGLSFVSGGDYTRSSVITGYWSLAEHNIFIGNTGVVGDSGLIRIGNAAAHSRFFAAGISGSNVSGGAAVVVNYA